MKSKIEKLERVKLMSLMGMMGEVAPQWVAKELNKIIDHLNSQDQEEENTVCEGCGKTITSRFMQSYTKGDGMHSYCLSCDPEKQDTPEEELHDKLLEIWCGLLPTPSKSSTDPEPIRIRIEGTEKYVKQFLEEREREVLEEVLKESDKRGHYYDEDTEYEVIKEMLGKLKDNK